MHIQVSIYLISRVPNFQLFQTKKQTELLEFFFNKAWHAKAPFPNKQTNGITRIEINTSWFYFLHFSLFFDIIKFRLEETYSMQG